MADLLWTSRGREYSATDRGITTASRAIAK
jgi:hypothetical protein